MGDDPIHQREGVTVREQTGDLLAGEHDVLGWWIQSQSGCEIGVKTMGSLVHKNLCLGKTDEGQVAD